MNLPCCLDTTLTDLPTPRIKHRFHRANKQNKTNLNTLKINQLHQNNGLYCSASFLGRTCTWICHQQPCQSPGERRSRHVLQAEPLTQATQGRLKVTNFDLCVWYQQSGDLFSVRAQLVLELFIWNAANNRFVVKQIKERTEGGLGWQQRQKKKTSWTNINNSHKLQRKGKYVRPGFKFQKSKVGPEGCYRLLVVATS